MVARSESMFGCYDSYSYRLWSLANVWNTCQFPSLTNGLLKDQQHHQEQHQQLQQVKQEDFANEYFIKCPQCQKGYQTFQALKEHMQDAKCCMENGVELGATAPTPTTPTAPGGPHGCPQCTTTFATKDQLEKHELLHSPNAQVSCKICNKTFANVYRLQRHMISHDESAVLRKFKCTECEKAFKFKHHLKEHIRIHSGEKPFECGNCGKRFSHSGSYSSHMTSKKCLVMNLKLGRTRTQNPGLLMEKPLKRPRLNNNLSTSPNHNAYLPILPKFTEAAAAFLQNSGMSPFYIPNTNLMNPSGTHPINPYSLSHILEQFHTQTPQEPTTNNTEEETTKSNSSSCDLIMDEDIIERTSQTNEESKDFVKRILETVNSNVTKELLQANMQKFNSETSSDAQSVATPSPKAEFACCVCKLAFGSQMALDDHDCVEKSEGLAAKLEDVVKSSESCGEDDLDLEKSYEDSESVTTTDHVSEDGRKVRVRSLISDEQLKVLKDNYALNPRPKREELLKIANNIGFPVRVVQVWFQNTRARDRREGRIINIPYNFQSQKYLPITTLNQFSQSDEPLDLSTKKSPLLSTESSPSNSPRRINSDSEDLKASSHQQLSSPSPTDFNSSRLAQILAQPKLALPSSMMVPMDQLMQFGTADLSSLSQLISSRMNSPGAEKKYEDGEERKMRTQYVLKGLGSPVLVGQGDEPEGQFTCDQCDKAFSKQSSLARHKYEHSGQRPHKCNECPKAFKHKHHLTEHKRLHSGEKPFQCCKCLKRFSHSGSYSQHMNHRYSYCKPYRE